MLFRIIKNNPLRIKIPHNITVFVIPSLKMNQPNTDAIIGSPSGTDVTTVVGKCLSAYVKIPCPIIVGIIPNRMKIVYSVTVKLIIGFFNTITNNSNVTAAEVNNVLT